MLLSIAILAAAQAKVSFSSPAKSAPELLAALGPAIGQSLEVSPELARERLVVKVQDAPVSVLLAKIAKVTEGEWQKTEKGLRLTRTPKNTARLAGEERSHITQGFQSEIARRQKLLASASADQTQLAQKAASIREYFESNEFGEGNPEAGRAELSREAARDISKANPNNALLLRLIDTQIPSLIDIPQGRGLVFSTQPTPKQRPFVLGAQTVLTEFRKSHKDWDAMLDRLAGPLPSPVEVTAVLMFAQVYTRYPGKMDLNVSLYGIDKVGTIMGGIESYQLTSYRPQDSETQIQAPAQDGKFSFSARAFAVHQFLDLSSGDTSEGGPPVTKEVEDFYLHPEIHSLLELRPSESLIAIADRANENVVANLADDSVIEHVLDEGKTGIFSFSRQELAEEQQIEEEDGWLTAKPAWPISVTAERTDRQTLGEVVRLLMANQPVALEKIAQYEIKVPDLDEALYENPLLNDLPISKYFDAGHEANGVEDAWDLQFYGALSPQQRSQLTSGAKLPLLSLSRTATNVVESRLFGSGTRFILPSLADIENQRDESAPANGDPKTRRVRNFIDSPIFGGLDEEATILLGRGIPSDAYATCKTEVKYVFTGYSKSFAKGRYVTIEELADRASKNGQADNSYEVPAPEKLRVGKMTTYDFTLWFTPTRSLQFVVEDINIDPKTQAVPLANLPPAVKAEIARRAREIESQGGGG